MTGLRYRKRMEQIDEFSRFHKLSPGLVENIRKYVSFSFAVTNGLNADAIGARAGQAAIRNKSDI